MIIIEIKPAAGLAEKSLKSILEQLLDQTLSAANANMVALASTCTSEGSFMRPAADIGELTRAEPQLQ